jgi:hypothetical protein
MDDSHSLLSLGEDDSDVRTASMDDSHSLLSLGEDDSDVRTVCCCLSFMYGIPRTGNTLLGLYMSVGLSVRNQEDSFKNHFLLDVGNGRCQCHGNGTGQQVLSKSTSSLKDIPDSTLLSSYQECCFHTLIDQPVI